MVATHAIQEASSAEREKPPPTSAIARSTSWEEMLEPTIAIEMTTMVSTATRSGGSAGAGTGGPRPAARMDPADASPWAMPCTSAFAACLLTGAYRMIRHSSQQIVHT